MKNLKKGLAVAMSLAMIATVMPTMKVDAARETNGTCETTAPTTHFGHKDLLDELAALNLEEATNDTKVDLVVGDEKKLGEIDAKYGEALDYFIGARTTPAWACASTDAEYTSTKKLAQEIKDILGLFGATGLITTKITAFATVKVTDDSTKKTAEELIKFFADNADHLTDRETAMAESYTARAEKLIANYEKENVNADNIVKEINSIVEKNTGLTDLNDATVYDIKGLEKAIDEIDDYMATLDKTWARDTKVKKAIKDVNDALDKINELADNEDALEDITLPKDFVLDADKKISWDGTADGEYTIAISADNTEKINELVNTLTSEDYKVLKAFDKVLLKSWSPVLEKETSRGDYKLYFDEGDVATKLTGDLLAFANVYYTPVMKGSSAAPTGDFVKDLIEERMDEVETAYNVVMKASALTSKVDDAIYELTDDEGMYVNNLTKAEFSNVFVKAASLGKEVGKTGWVDLGNGNWDYFNADGTKSTKWVAAGKLWYFVKDGHMLRNSWVAQDSTGNVWYYVNDKGEMVVNTTVDGYTINANGEWHK